MEARLDKWLWAARIFKTRSIAADACKNGRVTVKGVKQKPSKMIKEGEVIEVRKPPITYSFRVLKAIQNRVGAKLDPKKHHYVRLERVHVNEPAQSGVLSLPGRVESREYYGLYIKYYIQAGGQSLKVMERNDGIHIYDEGDSVTVNLNPADLMSYPAGGEEASK